MSLTSNSQNQQLIGVQNQQLIGILMLLTPLLTSPLIFISLHNEIIIVRLGVYFHTVLRPKIANITKDDNIFGWEEFHVKLSKSILFQTSGFLRKLVFFVPSITPIITLLLLINYPYSRIEKVFLALDIQRF
jgi:hypothetical protein